MENIPEVRNIEIGQDTLKKLDTTRKWAMFLAVSGFIFLGLILMLGLITGTFLTAFKLKDKIPGVPDVVLIGGFIILALLVFFPIFFLFRFSKHTLNAVSKIDGKLLHKAIKNLKLFFVCIGIILILIISAYIIALVWFGASSSFLRGL